MAGLVWSVHESDGNCLEKISTIHEEHPALIKQVNIQHIARSIIKLHSKIALFQRAVILITSDCGVTRMSFKLHHARISSSSSPYNFLARLLKNGTVIFKDETTNPAILKKACNPRSGWSVAVLNVKPQLLADDESMRFNIRVGGILL